MTLGQWITELAERAGIEATDPRLKDIQSIQVGLNDEIIDTINSTYMTVDAAKNNQTIASHFKAQFYNGIDALVNEHAASIDDEEFQNAVKSQTGTRKKVNALISKYKELSEKALKAAEGAGKGDETLKAQIAQLNSEISKYKEEFIPKSILDEQVKVFESERVEGIEKQIILNRNWSDNYVPSVRYDIAKIAINKKLNEIGAIAVRNGNEIKLVQKENPDMDFYLNNKVFKFDELVDKVMSENKFIAVSQPSQSAVRPNTYTPSSPVNGNSLQSATSLALARALQDQGL